MFLYSQREFRSPKYGRIRGYKPKLCDFSLVLSKPIVGNKGVFFDDVRKVPAAWDSYTPAFGEVATAAEKSR